MECAEVGFYFSWRNSILKTTHPGERKGPHRRNTESYAHFREAVLEYLSAGHEIAKKLRDTKEKSELLVVCL